MFVTSVMYNTHTKIRQWKVAATFAIAKLKEIISGKEKMKGKYISGHLNKKSSL